MSYDVIVVGGNFAGATAAMQLVRARRKVLLVDAGKPRNRFSPASHGFLGLDGSAPDSIMALAKQQLLAYPTIDLVQGEATAASGDLEGGFNVELADGRRKHGARLVLATGVSDDLPGIPGVAERWGRTVLHCPYCHGFEVADRHLGVIAAHPLSMHQALMIPDWGPTTYFTQGAFEPDEEARAKFFARGVAVESSPVVQLLGAAPALEAARLADGRVVPLGAAFIAARTRAASPLAEQLGCAFDEGPLGAFVRADEGRQTTVPGVWIAGDAGMPVGNATLASAAGVLAGTGAHRSLIEAASRPTARSPAGAWSGQGGASGRTPQ